MPTVANALPACPFTSSSFAINRNLPYPGIAIVGDVHAPIAADPDPDRVEGRTLACPASRVGQHAAIGIATRSSITTRLKGDSPGPSVQPCPPLPASVVTTPLARSTRRTRWLKSSIAYSAVELLPAAGHIG